MTTSIHALISEGAAGDRTIRLSPFNREFSAFTLFVIVTFVQFPFDELILYPLALYFSIRAWHQRDAVLGLMARSWPIMLFPLWCLLSPIWAVEPVEAFKHAVYMILTNVICYHIVLVLKPRQILFAALIATGAIGVLSLFLGLATGNMQTSVFGHKNVMGMSMVLLWTASLATFLDRSFPRPVRLVSFFLAAIAGYMVSQSNSATAVLLALGSATLCIVGALLLRDGLFRPSRLAIACLTIALSCAAASQIVNVYKGDPVEDVLNSFGKDSTLTGRTILWQYAENEIRDHPLLGVGYGGFWRYQASPLVRRIYEEFHKGAHANFQFHSSYYEAAVHQGLIGLGFLLAGILWTTRSTITAAVRIGEMPQVFFLSVTAVVLVRSITESAFAIPFTLTQMLFWIGALSAKQDIRFVKNP